MHTGPMGRRAFLRTMGSMAAMGVLGGAGCVKGESAAQGQGESRGKRPNIIVVMADDMGFSDPGCFGGEISTPNIDKLAREGLRFTQFYNCARCCPTRASLLTGLYQHQVGLKRNGQSLTRDGATIAEVLREAGYDTAMAGKWHLSYTPVLEDEAKHQAWLNHQYEHGPFAPLETYPIHRGFNRHYGVIWGVIDYFDPFSLVEGEEPVKEVPKDYYFTDAITDKAVEYVEEFGKGDKPFFLYFAHCAPHWPLHARAEDIAKYKGKYAGGWDRLRTDRYARQVAMGLFDPATAKLPEVQAPRAWDSLSAKEKAYFTKVMAVHAAMVDRVDQSIGRLVETLKRTGQYENTVIFFLADNGASPEVISRPGYDRPSETREGVEQKYGQEAAIETIGSQESYCFIGQAWANAVNTPFRYWKRESYEGGAHTPMIVHWPAGLKAKGGSVTEQVGHVMDLMPTCLALAGVDYPASYEGHELHRLEGQSLAGVIEGGEGVGERTLFFEHERGRAVRMGDWKLVALANRPRQWELYNLAENETEMNDLSETYPERAAAMREAWEAWAKRVGAM